jgi:RND superfamily putative drug exporter
MTLLGNANWWAPRFLRVRERRHGAPVPAAQRPAPEPELTGVG